MLMSCSAATSLLIVKNFFFLVIALLLTVFVAHVKSEHYQGFTDCRLLLMRLGLQEHLLMGFCYLSMLLRYL